MSTRPSAPYVLRRIVARTGAGMWRNRGSMLFGVAVLVAMGGYSAYGLAGEGTLSMSAQAAAAPVSTACADTAMAAVTDTSAEAIASAYDCLDPSFQQRVSQDEFVNQLQSEKLPTTSRIARIGDYKGAGGDTIVYYALDGSSQSVGHIVYLGESGKVLRID